MSDSNKAALASNSKSLLQQTNIQNYWRANKRVLVILLSVWLVVSFGLSVLLVDWLDQFSLGGFPLGYWFSHQGALLVYIALIFIYHVWMTRIETACGFDEGERNADSATATQGGKH
ncbi:DUF4212 domain-containing protein [Oceanicoccus sp. KOV_DT_Chl]|uniref:DUF4212 domain-containing protein n=1 Tax=Oceanicoccus sp. KOV_DT_Chl TaxID=1904639 RepID=UPI000C7DC7B2|nr:DUF4212 domain-containing protein [Oceanicoccus sp. KOV_DT_Chl]